MDFLQTPNIQMLSSALNASALRNRTILNNVANIDTPRFKSQQVVFEEELKKALQQRTSDFVGKRTHRLHIPIGGVAQSSYPLPTVSTNTSTFVQNNGNNVDLEFEMAQLAQNSLWYNALVQQTNGHFSKLREVIKEGR